MAQATRYGQLTFSDYVERALREGAMWTLMVVALYLVLALASYSPDDPGWSYVGDVSQVSNAAGRAGAWFADVTLFLFGFFAYLLPVMVGWSAWLVFRGRGEEPAPRTWILALRWIGFFITILAGCGYAAIHLADLGVDLPNGAGGGLGLLVSDNMRAAFNTTGTDLLLGGALFVGVTLFSGISWLRVVDNTGAAVLQAAGWITGVVQGARRGLVLRRQAAAAGESSGLPEALNLIDAPTPSDGRSMRSQHASGSEAPSSEAPGHKAGERPDRRLEGLPRRVREAMAEPETLSLEDLKRGQKPVPAEAPRIKTVPRPVSRPELSIPAAPAPSIRAPSVAHAATGRTDEISLPPLDLLDLPRPSGRAYSDEQIEDLSRQVELKLADFGVQVQVVAVYPGPVVTLFELELAPGIKVSKITGLAKDLARALSTISVRVVEVIPGKSVIGIEIPNQQRETVFLRQTFGSATYQDAKSPLTLGLGSDISGLPVVVDLAKMPHVLIAGTTGSGKSVAINAMILSLLYKAGPQDVRLIMVDPKMLELSVYEGIPHLLTPVVTDMKEAANALRWCVGEMERRYRLMAKLGVRNIGGYNRQIAEAAAQGQTIPDPTIAADFAAEQGIEVPALEHLPYIVVVIDELADMMMVVGKKVEELIARLAQKARASGIHLLLATQRPSVDVLTGLIKANIPTRIAFQVSSRIDSRTVLDQMGAEQLLGNGDMLYLPPGGNIPQRVHGAFVDDHEVHRIVEHLKQFGAPQYLQDVLREPTEVLPGIDPEPRGDTEDTDPLFDEAVQIVVESRRASISGVQRRLKIGYNRAARMIEEMERIGIVGAAETNGNREVLAPPPIED
ncbi:DNA translocase FtsK [Thiocapsa bogorovii]|uniref:DNA translocase FtsK n=1 Tax=Thiocapsa roseopersicina TaxID=1058 RepID=D8X0S1_THIRO|nr:DNA translocase FtsK [Thiocapsa bogorovii]ADK12983.1 DNA translocase [Thiocapsa roseopersicina]UHD14830.1 DNA translocase FtsK 4TM domain-containing protein [Thiocapsa bogorovii]